MSKPIVTKFVISNTSPDYRMIKRYRMKVTKGNWQRGIHLSNDINYFDKVIAQYLSADIQTTPEEKIKDIKYIRTYKLSKESIKATQMTEEDLAEKVYENY